MAPFELLLLSVLATGAIAAPASDHRGFASVSAVNSPQGLGWFQGNLRKGPSVPASRQYQCYHGDLSRYPSIDNWLSWDALWEINKDHILSQNGGNTYTQHYIWEAILQVSDESHVNARLILAAVMQESSGKASMPCTGSAPNCGLLQASFGSHAFDPSNAERSILQMVREGIEGTTSGGPHGNGGPGYVQHLSSNLPWLQNPAPGNPYAAARAYNSGSVGNNLDVVEVGKPSYSNDIANRLLGWDGTGEGFSACS